MKRSAPLARKTPLKAKGKSRFPERRDAPEGFLSWVRSLPCCVCLRLGESQRECGPTEVAHVKSRGAGGKDYGNVVPLGVRHHRIHHHIGAKSFASMYAMDLAAEARAVVEAWETP